MSAARKTCPQCSTEYDVEQRFCPRDGASLRAANAVNDLVGEVVADRYLITQKLGEGGMGQVYLAEHVRMGRKSAVKVMHPAMVHDADAIGRFNREASNASRINHPNVAAIYDFGETPEGLIYLAMEYVDGEPLTKLVAREGALAPARAAEIVRQTGEALAVAHDLGIVHRDLKPDNIMITRDRDGRDCVKVVDFGIAKAAAGEAQKQKVTKTGLVVGTPEFMSPEQLAGDPLDGRSDIYALGLVAFNMMTGALPFPSETAQESMIMRLTDRPRTLAEMRGDVVWPAEVQLVVDRALARDARERYQSAAEFGRDLVRAAALQAPAAGTGAGTRVIGSASLPPTRVAAARGSSADKATTVLTPPRRRAPRVAAAAVVGVLMLAAGAFASRALSPERSANDTTAVAHEPPSHLAMDSGHAQAPSPETLAVAERADTASHVPRAASRGAPREPVSASHLSATPTASSAPSIEPRLAEIAKLAESPRTAHRALQQVAQLLPLLHTHQDSVRALYHRGEAQLGLEDRVAGCATLAEIGRMPPTKYTVGANSLYTLAGCDP
jgi:eukaryotic-like serine/threonine-protein kinase